MGKLEVKAPAPAAIIRKCQELRRPLLFLVFFVFSMSLIPVVEAFVRKSRVDDWVDNSRVSSNNKNVHWRERQAEQHLETLFSKEVIDVISVNTNDLGPLSLEFLRESNLSATWTIWGNESSSIMFPEVHVLEEVSGNENKGQANELYQLSGTCDPPGVQFRREQRRKRREERASKLMKLEEASMKRIGAAEAGEYRPDLFEEVQYPMKARECAESTSDDHLGQSASEMRPMDGALSQASLKGIHSLTMQLTIIFSESSNLENSDLYHYTIFSDNVLAALVSVNSSVMYSKVVDVISVNTNDLGPLSLEFLRESNLSATWTIWGNESSSNNLFSEVVQKAPEMEKDGQANEQTQLSGCDYDGTCDSPEMQLHREQRELRRVERAAELMEQDIENLEEDAIQRHKSFEAAMISDAKIDNEKAGSTKLLMRGQITMAKVYLSIAKMKNTTDLVEELQNRIKESERAEAASDDHLRKGASERIRAMADVLMLARHDLYNCKFVIRKLAAMVQSVDERVKQSKKQVVFQNQLASKTMPKGIQCLQSLKDYYFLSEVGRNFSGSSNLENPDLYHYAIFSDNVLSASVAVHSTIINAKEPEKHVFHLAKVNMRFLNNPPGNASYCPVLRQQRSAAMADKPISLAAGQSAAFLQARQDLCNLQLFCKLVAKVQSNKSHPATDELNFAAMNMLFLERKASGRVEATSDDYLQHSSSSRNITIGLIASIVVATSVAIWLMSGVTTRDSSDHTATSFSSLPLDVTQEVLAHFPVRTLLSVRGVNRELRTFISSPQFRAAYIRESSRRPQLIFFQRLERGIGRHGVIFDVRRSTSLPFRLPALRIPVFEDFGMVFRNFEMFGSCNGLVALQYHADTSLGYYMIILLNPWTRVATDITTGHRPELRGHPVFFGLACINSSYRLILSVIGPMGGITLVLDLNGTIVAFEQRELALPILLDRVGTSVEGIPYWASEREIYRFLERFDAMVAPDGHQIRGLGSLLGRLSMVTQVDPSSFHVSTVDFLRGTSTLLFSIPVTCDFLVIRPLCIYGDRFYCIRGERLLVYCTRLLVEIGYNHDDLLLPWVFILGFGSHESLEG